MLSLTPIPVNRKENRRYTWKCEARVIPDYCESHSSIWEKYWVSYNSHHMPLFLQGLQGAIGVTASPSCKDPCTSCSWRNASTVSGLTPGGGASYSRAVEVAIQEKSSARASWNWPNCRRASSSWCFRLRPAARIMSVSLLDETLDRGLSVDGVVT